MIALVLPLEPRVLKQHLSNVVRASIRFCRGQARALRVLQELDMPCGQSAAVGVCPSAEEEADGMPVT